MKNVTVYGQMYIWGVKISKFYRIPIHITKKLYEITKKACNKEKDLVHLTQVDRGAKQKKDQRAGRQRPDLEVPFAEPKPPGMGLRWACS